MPDKKNIITYVDLKRPTIFAHRGSSAHAPENTLAAFKLALEQDADGIELDVKLSADNQVIVIHDETVDRTTDGTGRINSLTLSEIKRLDAGSKYSDRYKLERIPTLPEVFETVGHKIFINVELANYTSPIDDLPDRVIALVRQYGLDSNILLSSFNSIALIKARFLHPEIPLGLLTKTGIANPTLRSKLIRFGPLLSIHPDYKDVNQQLIDRVHRLNSRVHAYTVNQSDTMRQLFAVGVDGIFTPDPVLARKVLAEAV
jgi:glycerophosphoryl diester phosphodiesterase